MGTNLMQVESESIVWLAGIRKVITEKHVLMFYQCTCTHTGPKINRKTMSVRHNSPHQYGHEHVGMVWYASLLPLVGGEGDDCLSVASLPTQREVHLLNMAYSYIMYMYNTHPARHQYMLHACTLYLYLHIAITIPSC